MTDVPNRRVSKTQLCFPKPTKKSHPGVYRQWAATQQMLLCCAKKRMEVVVRVVRVQQKTDESEVNVGQLSCNEDGASRARSRNQQVNWLLRLTGPSWKLVPRPKEGDLGRGKKGDSGDDLHKMKGWSLLCVCAGHLRSAPWVVAPRCSLGGVCLDFGTRATGSRSLDTCSDQ